MAKSFYTPEEAASRLGKSPEGLIDLVKQGKLREFRDGGAIRYKVEDIDALAGPRGSGGAEIVLEPAEDDSSIVLSASGSDVLSLDELEKDEDSGGTAGTAAPGDAKGEAEKKKGDTVVSSVGISVFDDDELDEVVDPLAQTAVSDVAGLGVEGIGSGSGILDLTRESDDTSLGAELLEEIYSGDEQRRPAEDVGSKTGAGLAGVAEAEEPEEVEVLGGPAQEAGTRRAPTLVSAPAVEDAFSSGLTAAMVVATLVMCVGGLASAALVRGVTPSIISMVYGKMLYFAGGSLLLVIIATVVTFFLAKRSS